MTGPGPGPLAVGRMTALRGPERHASSLEEARSGAAASRWGGAPVLGGPDEPDPGGSCYRADARPAGLWRSN